MKKQRGRPPLPEGERKGFMLRIRMAYEDRELLDKAAVTQGQDMSSWARSVLIAKAKKAIGACAERDN